MLDYESKSIITCMKNHITANFTMFLNRYINILCNKKGFDDKVNSSDLDKKEKKSMIRKNALQLAKIKTDILYHTDKCDAKYNKIKNDIRTNILCINDSMKDKCINYYVTSDPLMFLTPLIRMSIKGEKIMQGRMNRLKKKDRKLFNIINCFPQRSNISPKHVTFDTTLLINNFILKDKRYYQSNVGKECNNIWNMFFETDNKVFRKKGYTFIVIPRFI